MRLKDSDNPPGLAPQRGGIHVERAKAAEQAGEAEQQVTELHIPPPSDEGKQAEHDARDYVEEACDPALRKAVGVYADGEGHDLQRNERQEEQRPPLSEEAVPAVKTDVEEEEERGRDGDEGVYLPHRHAARHEALEQVGVQDGEQHEHEREEHVGDNHGEGLGDADLPVLPRGVCDKYVQGKDDVGKADDRHKRNRGVKVVD